MTDHFALAPLGALDLDRRRPRHVMRRVVVGVSLLFAVAAAVLVVAGSLVLGRLQDPYKGYAGA